MAEHPPPAGAGRQVPRLADLRHSYGADGLSEERLAASWSEQLGCWLADAAEADLPELNAVTLATASSDGLPSARTVLLKGFDAAGLVVFTNLGSRKARDLAANPRAALVVPWLALGRQVRAEGRVEAVSREESAAYFASRPRGSQVGAWVSRQSAVIASRDVLEVRRREIEQRFAGGEVPLPDFWGGLRLVPHEVEFWQGRTDRLHDRLRFRQTASGWVVERLAP